MSQVHAVEISPTQTNGEWDQVEMEFEDRSILCVDCSQGFIWTAGEQLFFHDKGLRNEPKRCKPCKQAKNERLSAIAAAQATGMRQRIEVTVQCAQCGQQTTVRSTHRRAAPSSAAPASSSAATRTNAAARPLSKQHIPTISPPRALPGIRRHGGTLLFKNKRQMPSDR